MRNVLGFLMGGLMAASCGAAPLGEGLRTEDHWPQWQLRVSTVMQPMDLGSQGPEAPSLTLGAASVSGDRYFPLGRLGDGGGLRATGALLFGPPDVALGAPVPAGWNLVLSRPTLLSTGARSTHLAPTPYLGMGYTAWWSHSGWHVSADLGLLAQNPGRWWRPAMVNPQTGEALDSSPWLTPVMQLQLGYRF
ncbi:hypothetical protein KGA65_20095 [Ideonella sp. B7]|uniref:hypothetical protein n=1 Tax=Ideonella benzenivorans TaxID=2831643 RepID=UPI001CEC41F0|nr:hypothetical protein [Ideonella benzenivorans]MCA6218851.1 hypothetical protein [Ideonella benzenivorans]